MSIWRELRGFARALRRGAPSTQTRHRGHAIARTLKHGTTVIGANYSGSMATTATQRHEEFMTEAAEGYDKSFDKD
ncbi:MAG: hypothetical protein GY926_14885 [bacterium]|nr:hypothetical protein [bacterium]